MESRISGKIKDMWLLVGKPSLKSSGKFNKQKEILSEIEQ